MRHNKGLAVVTVAILVFLSGSALAQDISATIRTHQGASYKLTDPSLEVFYIIGEPRSMQDSTSETTGSQSFGSMINITNVTGGPLGSEQPGGGGGKEGKLLSGHSRATEMPVWRQGVEIRIAWDQIRAMRFRRNPVTVAGLRMPSYIPDYKYSGSVVLVSGEQVEADYVNLGGAVVMGTAPTGRLEIPWAEVESIIFER